MTLGIRKLKNTLQNTVETITIISILLPVILILKLPTQALIGCVSITVCKTWKGFHHCIRHHELYGEFTL